MQRATERLRELGVGHRVGAVALTGPVTTACRSPTAPARSSRRDESTASTDGPTDRPPAPNRNGRQHFAERAAIPFQHQAGANDDHARRAGARASPPASHCDATWARKSRPAVHFGDDLVPARPVVADRRAADKHRRRRGWRRAMAREAARRQDAAVEDASASRSVQRFPGDRFAGEVHDGAGAVDLRAQAPKLAVGIPGTRRAACRRGPRLPRVRMHDVAALAREGRGECTAEKSSAAGDDDFHGWRVTRFVVPERGAAASVRPTLKTTHSPNPASVAKIPGRAVARRVHLPNREHAGGHPAVYLFDAAPLPKGVGLETPWPQALVLTLWG